MINIGKVFQVTRKELLETLRDRRSLFLMVGLPVFLYPALMISFGQIVSHQYTSIRNQKHLILIIGSQTNPLREWLAKNSQCTIVSPLTLSVPNPPPFPLLSPEKVYSSQQKEVSLESLKAWAKEVFTKKEIDLILYLHPFFHEQLASEQQGQGLIFYDAVEERSQVALQYIHNQLQEFRDQQLKIREKNHPELPQNFLFPIRFETYNLASARQRGGYFAGRILPMILIIMVMLGAFYPAVDMTAGEKERGTMETLLTVPLLPGEIITGKFIAVCCISFFSAMANLGSMSLAFLYLLQSGKLGDELEFHMKWFSGIIMILQLIPVAIFFSALILGIAVIARSFKEAQNYLTPLYMVIIIPVAISSLPGFSLTFRSAWVPVINLCLLMRDLFVDPPSLSLILLVFLANIIYAIIAIWIAVQIFQHESILLDGGLTSFPFIHTTRHGDRYPTVLLLLILIVVGWTCYFYIGGFLQNIDLLWGLTFSQITFLFLPVVGIAYFAKLNFYRTFSLGLPKKKDLLGTFLCGVSTSVSIVPLILLIQNYILPEPPEFKEMMEQLFSGTIGDLSLINRLLLFAVLPAICEETFFRGFVLSGFLKSFSPFFALLFSSALFGFYHISIYRIIPTMMIGMIAGWIFWKTRSLVTSIFYHFLHNTITLVIFYLMQNQSFSKDTFPLWIVGIGWILFITGTYLIEMDLQKTFTKQ